MIKCALFEPILNIVIETMPKDNLLNSAALEFFDYLRRVSLDSHKPFGRGQSPNWMPMAKKQYVKPAIVHIVENYRERLEQITYVDVFKHLILRYEQYQEENTRQQSVATEEDRR